MNLWLNSVREMAQVIIDAPFGVLLVVKATGILLAAWLIHFALMRANPRWRVLLWRVTAVGLIALPVVSWCVPALKIHVKSPVSPPAVADRPVIMEVPPVGPAAVEKMPGNLGERRPEVPAARPLPMPRTLVEQPEFAASAPALPSIVAASASRKSSLVTWPTMILVGWIGGIGVLVFRLCYGHYRIGRMISRRGQRLS